MLGLKRQLIHPTKRLLDTLSLLDIGDIVDQGSLGIIHGDGDDLPVQLAVIDHGQDSEGLDLVHTSALPGLGSDLNNINRVVVSLKQERGSTHWGR